MTQTAEPPAPLAPLPATLASRLPELSPARRRLLVVLGGAAVIGLLNLVAVPTDYAYVPAGFVFLLLGLALLSFAPAEQRRFLATIFVIGMALRVAAGIAFYYTSLELGGDGTPAGKDDRAYYEWGSAVLDAWRDGSLAPPSRVLPGSTQHGYIYLNAVVFALFGQHLLVPVMFNAAAGALTAVPAFLVARRLWGERAGRVAAVLVAVYTHLIYYSALNMKDTLIALLASLALALVLATRERLTPARAATMVVLVGGLLALRPPVGGIAGALAAVFVALPAARRLLPELPIWAPGLAPAGTSGVDGATGYAVVQAEIGQAAAGARELTAGRAEAAAEEVSERLVGDDSFFRLVAEAEGLRRFLILPLAVVYTIVQPFPPWTREAAAWHFNVLILANLMWLALVPLAAYGFLHALRNGLARALPVLLFIALWLLAIAWTYYGIQSRYRVTLEPLAMAMAAGGIIAWPLSRPLVALWALAFSAAVLLYAALKMDLPPAVMGLLGVAWLVAAGVSLQSRLLAPLAGLGWLRPLPRETA